MRVVGFVSRIRVSRAVLDQVCIRVGDRVRFPGRSVENQITMKTVSSHRFKLEHESESATTRPSIHGRYTARVTCCLPLAQKAGSNENIKFMERGGDGDSLP